MPRESSLKILLILAATVTMVICHGRLTNPPSRASMWRFGFPNPPDYNDNQGFCGGAQNQHERQGGKCGVCGDPWQGPRTHEPGQKNKYANGIIVRHYKKNQVIDVTVEITAHHKGYFEFRLCPNNNPGRAVTHQCLDRFVLELETGGTKFYLPLARSLPNLYDVRLRLPSSVVCSQCVLQWKYNTGNSWGCDSPNNCGSGKGPQEQFYACADVEISNEGNGNADATTRSASTTTATVPGNIPTSPWERITTRITAPPVTKRRTTAVPTTPIPCAGMSDLPPCEYKASGAWAGQAGMNDWCEIMCPGPTCSALHCECVLPCDMPSTPGPAACNYQPVGPYRWVPGMNAWCVNNCPGNCPSSHCECV